MRLFFPSLFGQAPCNLCVAEWWLVPALLPCTLKGGLDSPKSKCSLRGHRLPPQGPNLLHTLSREASHSAQKPAPPPLQTRGSSWPAPIPALALTSPMTLLRCSAMTWAKLEAPHRPRSTPPCKANREGPITRGHVLTETLVCNTHSKQTQRQVISGCLELGRQRDWDTKGWECPNVACGGDVRAGCLETMSYPLHMSRLCCMWSHLSEALIPQASTGVTGQCGRHPHPNPST